MSDSVARAGADLRLLRAAVFTAVCVALSAAGHVLASCQTVPLWTLGVGALAVFAVAAPLAGRERSLPGIAAALAVGQITLHSLFGLGQHGAAMPRQHAAAAASSAGTSGTPEGKLIALAGRLLCNQPPVRLSVAEAQRVVSDAGLGPTARQLTHAMHSAPEAAAGSAGASATAPHSPSLLDTLPPSLPMLLGHLLAALAAGWLLRRGEVALWRLVALSAGSALGVAEGALVRALRAAVAFVQALRAGLPGAPAAADRSRRARPYDRGKSEPRVSALQHFVIRRGPPHFDLAA
ncbi:hypothetical protein [Streptomyces sp. H27-D2]|uniref:hypothetical protein n=1 Tax=Streptomyces sp. H27-D2 TaxID=3046304 RepID=UPI002DBC2660|nr:hypothetical protein [Streptomyces sp. H27-D2]MEC4015819.1 hypothetical protein [Streptomyces sp. H27-D2]